MKGKSYWLWFLSYVVAFALGAAALGLLARDHILYWPIAGFLYMSLANAFVPLPTTGMLLVFSKAHMHDGLPPWLSVGMMAFMCAMGTAVANMNEYFLISLVFRSRRVARFRDTRIYRQAVKIFKHQPFLLLSGMNLLPLPVDIVRWLAITWRYDRRKYFFATFTGRFIRYCILLTVGKALDLPLWAIGVVIGVLGLIGLIRLLILRHRHKALDSTE